MIIVDIVVEIFGAIRDAITSRFSKNRKRH